MRGTAKRMPLWISLLAVLTLVAAAGGGDGEDEGGADTGTTTEDPAAGAGTEDMGTEDAGTEDMGTEDAQASGPSCVEGENVSFVVSFDAGGGYDQIARTMAPVLSEELGATVVVENQPGAGGLLAMRNLQTAPADGTVFGFFTGQGMVGSVVGGAEGAEFDILEDFAWIGRVAADQRVMAVPGSSEELQSIEDVQGASGLRYATAGPGANDYIDAVVLLDVLGVEGGEIITGFTGSEETALALTTGDVDLASGTVGSRLSSIESGDHNPVLILSGETSDDLPDVPPLLDLELPEDKLPIAEGYVNLQEMGRMIWAPGGIEEACLTDLVDAVEATLENEQVVSQLEQADQEIDWVRGEEMRATAESLLDAPPEFQALLEQAYTGG